jgi:ABC-type dipeptide/oligopeptide/nickel transport system permease component
MFRYALRRLLWSIPALLATSFVLFVVTTLAPGPAAPARGEGQEARDIFEQAQRARFLDLPSFVNTAPADVQSRARTALATLADDGGPKAGRDGAARELQRLGGAALPHVLPALEALAPAARRRVAVALAPVAERMGVGGREDLTQPDSAAVFWTRFWDDRALDFTRPSVNRAVTRLVEHGSDLREADLVPMDTFALQAIVRSMRSRGDHVTMARLTRLAHHATGRGPVIGSEATDDEVQRAVADWREWWFVYSTDFVEVEGAGRAVAMLADTRYGKWLRRIVSGELGVSAIDGEPVLQKLREKGPTTLLLCALAMLVSEAVAVPLAVLGAWRRGGPLDLAASIALFVLYTIPTFAVALVLLRATDTPATGAPRLLLAVTALSVGSMATLSRWQRNAMLEVMREDFVRTARAKGVPGWRVLVVHALRNALMPTVTLAGTHLPGLLGGAIVVEEVFGLHGAGFETLRAIESHDAPWLMAVLLAAALTVSLGLIASDVAYGLLDPRVRGVLWQRQGGPAS